jgi:hypothetical protein
MLNAAFIALCLSSAQGEPLPDVPQDVAPAPVVEPAPAPPPDAWPGEERRVRFGVGPRVHAGVMMDGVAFLVLQSEVLVALSVRLWKHDELRVQLGIAGGAPDIFGGETNISWRHALDPRYSIGAGFFVYWGAPSYRGGLEVIGAMRLGARRRHEVSLSLRVSGGVFNPTTYQWYQLQYLQPAYGADAAVGYTFFF